MSSSPTPGIGGEAARSESKQGGPEGLRAFLHDAFRGGAELRQVRRSERPPPPPAYDKACNVAPSDILGQVRREGGAGGVSRASEATVYIWRVIRWRSFYILKLQHAITQ